MRTLEQAARGAVKAAGHYRACIAITSGDPEEGYGWCPLHAFLTLHGPLAKAGIVRIVDLVGVRYAESDPAPMMEAYGGGR